MIIFVVVFFSVLERKYPMLLKSRGRSLGVLFGSRSICDGTAGAHKIRRCRGVFFTFRLGVLEPRRTASSQCFTLEG